MAPGPWRSSLRKEAMLASDAHGGMWTMRSRFVDHVDNVDDVDLGYQ